MSVMKVTPEKLRVCSIFQGLPTPVLVELAARMHATTTQPDKEIVSQADMSGDMYILLSGEARVEFYTVEGKLIALRKSYAGDLVGELSAIDQAPRSATVRALTEVEAAQISGAGFQEVLKIYPDLALKFIASLVFKVREMSSRVFEFGALDVNERILCELWRIAQTGEAVADGILIQPAPTHEIIAYHVATHREAVSRLLSSLQSEGIVERSRGRILIQQPDVLRDRVSQALGTR